MHTWHFAHTWHIRTLGVFKSNISKRKRGSGTHDSFKGAAMLPDILEA